jgi:isoleucyl-tRNA synthetase
MTGALEVARTSKVIGSSLQANVTLFVDSSQSLFIQDVDLSELSITSGVEVVEGPVPERAFSLEETPNVGVLVTLASGDKCNRCWKVLPEVGTTEAYPDLCRRCASVVGRHDVSEIK